jgi:hypothetical protein
MIQDDNTPKNLEVLFKTSKITMTEFSFRTQAKNLGIKTYQDDGNETKITLHPKQYGGKTYYCDKKLS